MSQLNKVSREDFFWWKVGALTHDPPHKAWIMAELLKDKWKTGLGKDGVEAARRRKIGRAHERAAFAIRTNIFSEDVADYLDGYPEAEGRGQVGEDVKSKAEIARNTIKKSDVLAAAFDRWQVSELDELGPIFNVKSVYLVNPFSGDLVKSEAPKDVRLNEFEERLRRAWGEARNLDLSLRYHLFYATYEPLFYEEVHSLPSPADRRAPTHTVFDHVYACAAVVNWLCSDAMAGKKELHPKGLLARIDLAGVQGFINASRKLRDLWFSSWLSSLLLFKTIEELVKCVGPDVLIRPTARHNPFYYCSLLRWLKDEKAPEAVTKELEEVAKKYAGLEGVWPQYAVIPATVDLMLPPYEVLSKLLCREIRSEGEFVEYLRERYVGCWKELVGALKEGVEGLKVEGELKRKLEEATKEVDTYQVEGSPPLVMRVVTVSVPEELNDEGRGQERLYYDNAFKKLNNKFEAIHLVKIHPACLVNLTEATEDAWRRGRGYRTCTTCGKLPSVFDIPYDEKNYLAVVPQGFRMYLDPGEHLCPYCLIKRLATHPKILGKIVGALVGLGGGQLGGFASTSHIALYPFLKGLRELMRSPSCERVKDAVEKVDKGLASSLQQKGWLERLKGLDVEDVFFTEEAEARKRVQELRRVMEECGRDMLDPAYTRINTYYAIVRANGDYIGELFAGRLNQETIGVDYMELQASSMEDIPDAEASKFARLLREGANNNVRVVERILRSELGRAADEVKRAAVSVCEMLSRVRSEGRLPVTPAYHAALSRALMITALKDIEAVREVKGEVIYAGGDDFLAFVPSAFALHLVRKTRSCYSVGDSGYRGFHRVGSGLFASLGRASRSYSVVFGHFKYPMSRLLELSYELVESAKRARMTYGALSKSKDMLLLAYSPRGGGVKAKSTIPLSSEEAMRLLTMLVSSVEDGLLSHSLAYDLLRELGRYEGWMQQFEALGSILSYVLSRNLMVEGAEPSAKLLAFRLRGLAGCMIFGDEGRRGLLEQVASALWATIAALRGQEP